MLPYIAVTVRAGAMLSALPVSIIRWRRALFCFTTSTISWLALRPAPLPPHHSPTRRPPTCSHGLSSGAWQGSLPLFWRWLCCWLASRAVPRQRRAAVAAASSRLATLRPAGAEVRLGRRLRTGTTTARCCHPPRLPRPLLPPRLQHTSMVRGQAQEEPRPSEAVGTSRWPWRRRGKEGGSASSEEGPSVRDGGGFGLE